jgi:hypothetical protein
MREVNLILDFALPNVYYNTAYTAYTWDLVKNPQAYLGGTRTVF